MIANNPARSAVLVAALACAGCSAKQRHAAAPPSPAAEPGLEIVELRSRDNIIVVTSGPDGPLYSAKTYAGETLVSNVTLGELRDAHPELYKQIMPVVATDQSEAVGEMLADKDVSADVMHSR
jgi:hypothetical protein